MEENTVEYLQSINFDRLTLQQKIDLKGKGRPIPSLMISKAASSRGKSYVRQFNADLYSKNVWLCGCNKKNALFCFPLPADSSVAKRTLTVREVWGSIPGPVKSARLATVATILRSCAAQALSRGDGPRNSLHASA